MKYIFFIFLFPILAEAKLNIIATTTDMRAIVEAVGKDLVEVQSFVKGTQDPHFLEAKPSYMLKINKADLLVANGLDLEVGWLPPVLQGARNNNIAPGKKGYIELGALVSPLELPHAGTSRADGDVHPFGNPHFTLDPIRVGEAAIKLADKLSELDPEHRKAYIENAQLFQKELEEKTKHWSERIKKTGHTQAISYHKTLTYFFHRFGIKNTMQLEPKPGVPPTSTHIMEVMKTMKDQKVSLVLVENYFDATVANKIKQEISSAKILSVPVSVEGESGLSKNMDVYETIVKRIEGK